MRIRRGGEAVSGDDESGETFSARARRARRSFHITFGVFPRPRNARRIDGSRRFRVCRGGGARDRGDRARASRASGRLPRNPSDRRRGRCAVTGRRSAAIAREDGSGVRCFAWRARKKCDRGVGWNTYRRACRHACRSRRGPRRHHRPRGGYARAGGRTRASRCEGERGESCVSARLRQAAARPREKTRRFTAARCRGRDVSHAQYREGARAVSDVAKRTRTQRGPGRHRRRRCRLRRRPPGGEGGGRRCRQPKTWSWVVVLRGKRCVFRTPIRSDGASCGRDESSA